MDEIDASVQIAIDDAVKQQCAIRGIKEDEVRRVLEEAITRGYVEGDGTGRRFCKGSPEPGRYLVIIFGQNHDGSYAVLEACEV